MTHPHPITETDVRSTLEDLHRQMADTGRRPSVLALARRLGLPNTTLRRRFPAICADLAPGKALVLTPQPGERPAGLPSLRAENARLRQDNLSLAANLEIAIANIQRLSLEADQLREALQHAHGVTRLPRKPR